MIRSIGRLGPLKVAGLVIWELRYTLLAVAIAVSLCRQGRRERETAEAT